MTTLQKQFIAMIALIGAQILLSCLVFVTKPDPFAVNEALELQGARYTEAELEVLSDETLGSAQWRDLTLPHNWHDSGISSRSLWYRFEITQRSNEPKVLALYIPKVVHNLSVYLNGSWLGASEAFGSNTPRHQNIPQYFRFSSDLLSDGSNTLLIQVNTLDPSWGLLDKVYYGDAAELDDAYHLKYGVRVGFIKWLSSIMFAMSIVLFCFWLYRKHDTAYGIFGFTLFFWSLHNTNMFWINPPLDDLLWEVFIVQTLGWTVTSIIWFDHRYLGLKSSFVEPIFIAHSLSGLLLYLCPDISSLLFWGYGIWYGFLILFGAYAVFFLNRVFFREQNWDAYWMMSVGSIILVFGVHDILLINQLFAVFDGFIIQYSAFPTLILFCWFLLRRFLGSLETAERLARNLESRIQQKSKELKIQYEENYLLQQENILSQERERIMRDVHDGFGGQLLALHAHFQNQSGEAWENARDRIKRCLIDLRFVIDSLDPNLNDLTTLMALMRSRLEDLVTAAGYRIQWEIGELDGASLRSPQACLHLMRIVQEAVNNAVKHSGGNVISIATTKPEENQNAIRICIRDNGQGVNVNNANLDAGDERKAELDTKRAIGRGLANMRWRAEQLGATLRFELAGTEETDGKVNCGTMLELTLNL